MYFGPTPTHSSRRQLSLVVSQDHRLGRCVPDFPCPPTGCAFCFRLRLPLVLALQHALRCEATAGEAQSPLLQTLGATASDRRIGFPLSERS